MKVGLPEWVVGNEAAAFYIDSWLDSDDEIREAWEEKYKEKEDVKIDNKKVDKREIK